MNESVQQIDIIKIYGKKRCLVVDDLTDVRAAHKRMLRSFGAQEVDAVATGDETMQMCEARHYGMIICDYNLNESRDGQQVLEELRHMKLLKYTTLFIIITAETSREMVLGAIENQPDDYITKPISQKMMRTRLDRALIKHESLYDIKSAMDDKNYPKAIRLCDEKIKQGSRYKIDCIRYKAQIYWLMNDLDGARKIYEFVLKQKNVVWAKLGLAKALLYSGQYDNVEAILKDILREDNRYIEAHDLLAEFYRRTSRHDKAQESISTATKLSPKSILRHRRLAQIAENNNDDDVCLKAYEEAIRWNYGSCHASPDDYLGLARKTIDTVKGSKDRDAANKSKKALAILDRMTKRFPDDKSKVRSDLVESQLHFFQGKETAARAALERAESAYEDLDAKDINTRFDYARAHIGCGDKEKAYKELRAIAQENKSDKDILDTVDRISEEPISSNGKNRAAELSKAGIEAYQNKQYDKAIETFDEALKLFPNHIGVNLNMIQVSLAKVETEKMTMDLKKKCDKCLSRIVSIASDHKQYDRYAVLKEQYQKACAELSE